MPAHSLRSAGRQWAEKALALVPVFLALGTLFVAVMQQLNGLAVSTTIQTLVFGWLLLTPVAALLLWPTPDVLPDLSLGLGLGSDSGASATAESPIEELRTRYANGDISEAEFERRLDRLLESEDRPVSGSGGSFDAERERELDPE